MSLLLKKLSQLGFTNYSVDKLNLVTILSAQERCGIYVLHFSNDHIYVGQTIHIDKRYVDHRKTYDDITSINFMIVDLEYLNKTEKDLIQQLEKMGFYLRNKVHTSVTYAPSLFDDILTRDEQTRWLQNPDYRPNDNARSNDEVQRQRYARNFQKFMQHPLAEESIGFLRAYIKACIPQPNASERYYWSCSCLLPKQGLFYRVNINRQEVLYVSTTQTEVKVVWRLAKTPLFRNIYTRVWLSRLFQKYGLTYDNFRYEPGGLDQFTLWTENFSNATQVTNDSRFVNAMRIFNLRLMRKGPNLNYKSHCYDLADRVLD